MKYKKSVVDRNTAQLLLNTFLFCLKLRTGSLVVACTNIVVSVLGIWHSLHFGRACTVSLDCSGIGTIHHIWIGISAFSLVVTIYLLLCLIKKNYRGINIWIVWNGFVLILRLTVVILILALSTNNKASASIIFHFLAWFLTIMEGELDRKLTKPETMFAQLAMLYSILVLLSYYQQVTLTSFGYYQRTYEYPKRRFRRALLVTKDEDYLELGDDDDEDGNISEAFV